MERLAATGSVGAYLKSRPFSYAPNFRELHTGEVRKIPLPRTSWGNRPVHISKHSLPLLIVAKIILLGDAPMRINPYAALAGGATDCRTNKETVSMRHENAAPANRRPLAALYNMPAVALVFLGILQGSLSIP